MKRVLVIVVVLLLVIAGAYRFGSGIIASRAGKQWLESQGIAVQELSVRYANIRDISVAKIVLGTNSNITVENADISVARSGKKFDVMGAKAQRLTLSFSMHKNTFDIGGIESLAGLAALQQNARELAQNITIDGAWNVSKNDGAWIVEISDGIASFSQGELELTLSKVAVTITAHPDNKMTEFVVTSAQLQVMQAQQAMTELLQLSATGSMSEKGLRAQGKVADVSGKWPSMFSVVKKANSSKTTVQWTSPTVTFAVDGVQPSVVSPLLASLPPLSAKMRMAGSCVLSENVAPKLRHVFTIERAELSPLLKMIFKDDISVTGFVSGDIPMRWSGEKIPQIIAADLINLEAGTLTYDPMGDAADALSGQPQSNIMLDALKGFSYTALSIKADSDAQGVVKALFHVKGSNPAVFNSKPIELNVNVNGNLLAVMDSQSKVNDIIEGK